MTLARTNPRQAGSPRSLDRWQRTLRACLRDLRPPLSDRTTIARVRRRLLRLVASVGRAERR